MLYGGSRSSKNLNHEHQWHIQEDEPARFEDQRVHVFERCEWVEITGSATDHSRDETYYETGAKCDAMRTTTFRLDEAVRQSDGADITEDPYVEQYEELALHLDKSLSGRTDDTVEPFVLGWWSYDGIDKRDRSVTIGFEGEAYELTFVYEETTVDERASFTHEY